MSDLTGQSIGPYRLVDKLGDGGMATVYKAYDPRLDRYVALKCIHPQLVAAPGFLQRFEREAQILARLAHPNIVHLYDFGEADGHCYLAMEYGAGGTLKDRLHALHTAGLCMALGEVQRILLQLSAALDYAHQHGILHRDIKPSNILLTDDGRALLSDFGLARMLNTPSDLTSLGAMVGTPAYLSPEQGRGETASIGPPSDVYALGVVLYELLTGRVPFTAETPLGVVLKQLNQPVPPARALNPALPAALEPVLRTALAKDPAARYQRAGQLVQAFHVAMAVTAPARPAAVLQQSVPVEAAPPLSAQANALTMTAPAGEVMGRRARAAEQPVTFGALLRRYREAAGLSQEELAERAGLTVSMIGVLERGERKRLYPHTLQRLARVLDLDETRRAALIAAAPSRGTIRPASARMAAPAAARGASRPVITPDLPSDFPPLHITAAPLQQQPAPLPLLATKLYTPPTRTSLVPRPRLVAQLHAGLHHTLTLIAAPAGFGKTTLLASCVTGCGMPVAWLSLDKNDNQAGRFLSYLIAALQQADTTIGCQAAHLLAASPQAPPETILTNLINDLDSADKEMILVLDDYQFISNQAVHEGMTFLLEHCPTTLHLVIASRSDPPLPVARLRARGQTVELRAADLCFSEAEAAQFLNDVMGLHLDAFSVAALEERTEGWIAGLQMAALSMRDRKDVVGFIRGFSGTNRYILDYLLEEVLASQSPETQRFLLCTSILERLTAPLCDAVLDAVLADDQGSKWEGDDRLTDLESLLLRQSASVLEELERSNLFLVPLDDERKWYRYHHLFADLLRARLDQLSPGLSPRLHARAASWYESNSFYEDAIHHALAGGDYPAATRLVEAVAENAWLNGQYATILAWTKAIPAELMYSRPWLCIWNAWAFSQMGVPQALDQWITAAEQATKKQHEDSSSIAVLDASQDAQALMNEIAALRVFAVSFSQEYDRAIELAETVLNNPPVTNTKVAQFTRCNLLHLLSSMYYATGNLIKAEQTCRETIELAKEMGFTLRHLNSINKLILINKVNGHLHRSYQLIEETLSFLQEQGCNTYFAAAQLRFRTIELFYEWNHLEELQRLVELVLKQDMLVDVPYLLVDCYNIQALDLLNKKDYLGAQDALNKARALARQTYIWEGLSWRTESLQVRLWLKKGDLSLAVAWASQQTADRDDILRFSSESRAVGRARILLAQGACPEAICLLDRLSDSAEAQGRNGSLIEIRALKAIAFLGLEELGQAVAEVASALALAEPEGYVRSFLDEGPPMSTLLSHIANHTSSPHANYALRLLTAFGEEQGSARSTIQPMVSDKERASSLPSASSASLIEPLSRRELEVLHLIALGRTNQEIAQQLIVAAGTVKAHTASIYGKLDVANRTEAVARARQLGILP